MSFSQSSAFEAQTRVFSLALPALVAGRISIACPATFSPNYSQVLGFRLNTAGGTRTTNPRLLSIGPATAEAEPNSTAPYLFVGAGAADTSLYTIYWVNNDPNEQYKSAYSLLPYPTA